MTSNDVAAYYAIKVEDMFDAAEAKRARDVHAFSASVAGRCARAGSYRMARTLPDEGWRSAPKRAATLGTAWHEFAMPMLAKECGSEASTEVTVTARVAGIEVTGRYDLYDPHSPNGPSIVDKKTVGAYMWRRIIAGERPYAHRIQNYLYALACVQNGQPVDWVVWIYLNRDSGADHIIVERFDDDCALEAIERVSAIVGYSRDPDSAPREEPGPSAYLPSRSWTACDACPWLKRCWGSAENGQAPQASALADIGAAEAVEAYDAARAAEVRARDDKEFARAVLTGVPAGVYGALDYRTDKRGSIRITPTTKDT